MFTGIDVGGTNTDIAFIKNDAIETLKLSNKTGISSVLSKTGIKGKLAISTSQPLNKLFLKPENDICTINISGPGLFHPFSVKGAISIRGDILEDIDSEEIKTILKKSNSDYLAVSCKFSVRNPVLEKKVSEISKDYFKERNKALSHHIGTIGYPSRIAATRMNAQIKGVVLDIGDTINNHFPNRDFFFMKGDGGLYSPDMTYNNPSVLYNSSNAAVVIGSGYLSKIKDALVIDIGGTTTDFVPMEDGMPKEGPVEFEGKDTGIGGIRSISIPYGGDSIVEAGGLLPFREGPARAFGGYSYTLTDALNVCGQEIGDFSSSKNLNRNYADRAVEDFYKRVEYALSVYSPKLIIAAGYLSPILGPKISEMSKIKVIIPEHAESASAVGVAVSKLSLSLSVHYDSGKSRMSVNGLVLDKFKKYLDDDELIEDCILKLRKTAMDAGSPEDDCENVIVKSFRSYDVVKDKKIEGRIVDLCVSIPPGISSEVS
ncbi:hypothetical protein L1994_05150 [Methanomicrobium antiquum]|uniref:Hydantoinase/oxoprolinase family protein n=1 Tax=Methanomicrobium antiquum TaxID=487686 RepID=A0AAF0FTR4_9EURY|nr:hydantoinase/oxoprolinase family protein [Methanomicrobium antiquum]MDD3977716.1 hydantoinase/oxoprolinase family protein [Methanomicrobium sp.]WFN37776.1 hypothetical protein L1994_05150 [Methanomicrobium antiquum]